MPEDARDRLETIRRERLPWLWTNFVILALGVWLLTSPFTFGYVSPLMRGSDVASGALLVLFAALSLSPRWDFLGRWLVCGVGAWLQFAPLLFWAPTAAAYLNNTLVGALAIVLSVVVPRIPGWAHREVLLLPGPEIPPGWSYNPSSWAQRAPIIALALGGWFISRYLAAVQLGYLPTAWDPFFGPGTDRVLFSEISEAFPVSDAGLGAVAYTFEALLAIIGGTARWRTMPWLVLFFGILVVPLGVVHILLVISQPVAVGEWCTLCLAAAAIALLMIPLALDEALVTLEALWKTWRQGGPVWRILWVGETLEGGGPDTRSPRPGAPLAAFPAAMVWGVSLPWTLLASVALGFWLVAAPAVFGIVGPAADANYLLGLLAITFAVIATAELARAVRFVNLLVALGIVIAPWLLPGAPLAAQVNNLAAGVLLLFLTFPRGPVRESYGSLQRLSR